MLGDDMVSQGDYLQEIVRKVTRVTDITPMDPYPVVAGRANEVLQAVQLKLQDLSFQTRLLVVRK